jgi:hypothetical protein
MKTISITPALALLLASTAWSANSKIPKELCGVRIGMSSQELKKAGAVDLSHQPPPENPRSCVPAWKMPAARLPPGAKECTVVMGRGQGAWLIKAVYPGKKNWKAFLAERTAGKSLQTADVQGAGKNEARLWHDRSFTWALSNTDGVFAEDLSDASRAIDCSWNY